MLTEINLSFGTYHLTRWSIEKIMVLQYCDSEQKHEYGVL